MAMTRPPIRRTVQVPQLAGRRPNSLRSGQSIRSAAEAPRLRSLAPAARRFVAFGVASVSLRPPQMNSKPRKRPATATTANVIVSSTTPKACRNPSDVTESACWVICMANIWSPGPPSRVGVMKKPIAATKTSRKPAPMPGKVSGSSTRQKAAMGPAPLASAARVRLWSRRATLE